MEIGHVSLCRELRRLQDRLIQTEARHFQALQDVKLRILEELDAAQRAPKPAQQRARAIPLPDLEANRCCITNRLPC